MDQKQDEQQATQERPANDEPAPPHVMSAEKWERIKAEMHQQQK